MALPSSHPRYRRTSMAECSPQERAARARPVTAQVSATRFHRAGARFVEQETTHGRWNQRPLEAALLSSGTVHIPDACAKSNEDFRKNPARDDRARLTPKSTSNCGAKKIRKLFRRRADRVSLTRRSETNRQSGPAVKDNLFPRCSVGTTKIGWKSTASAKQWHTPQLAESRDPAQPVKRRVMSVMFCPPKPKLLLSTWSQRTSRATLGT
jgi:hypothetical protein